MRFEKKIKKELDKEIPSDGYEKIVAKAEEAGYFDREEIVPAGGAVAIRKRNKPLFLTLCAFLLAAAVSLCIVLPLVFRKTDIQIPAINRVELSVSDFYGTGAVTSVKLLSSGEQKKMSRASGKNQNSVNEQIEYFNKYLTAFDEFLGDGFVTTEVAENNNQDYGQYKNIMTVNSTFTGEDGYTMYFNETLVKDDGDETAYVLDGVMNVGGKEYLLRGERSTEDDGDESEEELKIRAYTAEAPSDYVEMKQEVSVEDGEREVEYVYKVYTNNKLVEETSVEFETETKNGKSQTEFELEFRNGDGKGKYKLEKEVKNGAVEMSVKYSLNGVSGKFKIYETVKDGAAYYEYVFEDGSMQLIKK